MANKKNISILVLTLVTSILLVFAVLPHHHHREEVCFTNTHCHEEASEPATHECDSEGDHSHDLPGQDPNCLVVNLFLLPDMKAGSCRPVIEHQDNEAVSPAFLPEGTSVIAGKPEVIACMPRSRLFACLAGKAHSLRGPPEIA